MGCIFCELYISHVGFTYPDSNDSLDHVNKLLDAVQGDNMLKWWIFGVLGGVRDRVWDSGQRTACRSSLLKALSNEKVGRQLVKWCGSKNNCLFEGFQSHAQPGHDEMTVTQSNKNLLTDETQSTQQKSRNDLFEIHVPNMPASSFAGTSRSCCNFRKEENMISSQSSQFLHASSFMTFWSTNSEQVAYSRLHNRRPALIWLYLAYHQSKPSHLFGSHIPPPLTD